MGKSAVILPIQNKSKICQKITEDVI